MFYDQNTSLTSTVVVTSGLQQGEHTAVIIRVNGNLFFRRMCIKIQIMYICIYIIHSYDIEMDAVY